MDSILSSIRELLDIPDDSFDPQIIIHINSALSVLTQLGIGPEEGFKITGDVETWDLFIGNFNDLEMVKNNVYLRVRLFFDPPQTSFAITSLKEQLKELDWRLEVAKKQ